jgi:ATP-dependent helicase HrpB
LKDIDAEARKVALLKGIRSMGLDSLPWSKSLRIWQARVLFLRRRLGDRDEWPDVSDKKLLETLETWLGPYLSGVSRLKDVGRKDLAAALHGHLTWPQQQRLERLAPTHLDVPSGSRRPIDYSGEIPVLAVRIQEMFGARETPTIAEGRQALLIHLLSPAGRPAQITQDLAGFWINSYPDVKKELKGRYPKHFWPDDPLTAQPTARVRPR